MITARAVVALKAAIPANEQHLRDLSTCEKAELIGEGADWTSAKEACQIPDGAVVLSWMRC